jgi:hypothetical protein
LEEKYRREHPEEYNPDVIEAMSEINREFPGMEPDESYLRYVDNRKQLIAALVKIIVLVGVFVLIAS